MLYGNLPEKEDWKQQKAKSLKKQGNLNSMLDQIKLAVKVNTLKALK